MSCTHFLILRENRGQDICHEEVQGIKAESDLVRGSEMASLRKCRGLGERELFSFWALCPTFKEFGLYCKSRAIAGFIPGAGQAHSELQLSCSCSRRPRPNIPESGKEQALDSQVHPESTASLLGI